MAQSALDDVFDVAAGQVVFQEGQTGTEMYIIERGAIEILRASRGDAPLAVLEPGDFFGEMAVLEDKPRFATARAREATRLIRVPRAAFANLIQQNFEIAVRIMRKLAIRLRRTEQTLQSAQQDLSDLKNKLDQAPTDSAKAPVAALSGKRVLRMKLSHASGSVFPIYSEPSEHQVGRPDPVTGVVPEINLGALDQQRTLSRRHAKILIDASGIRVREEVGAANGTQLNGIRLRTGDAALIKAGDLLQFGAILLTVQPP